MVRLSIWLTPVLALSLAACSVDRTEVDRKTSPDGHVTAVLMRETGGGAAGSSAYYVYLLEPNGSGKLKDASFVASRCAGLSLTWSGDHTLQLRYPSGCAIKQFVNLWYSPAAIANAQPADVEIVLVRNSA